MSLEVAQSFFGVDGKTVNINGFRTNATLQYEEWREFDNAVVKAYQERLVGVADLYAKGLVKKLSNGMSRTVLTYENLSDVNDAEMSMDAINRSKGDRPLYSTVNLPLPIIHKDFQFGARVLAESRNMGDGLDVTSAELAARKVADYAENILFNGTSSYAYGGGTIYGYVDAPNATAVALPLAWDNASKTGDLILTDMINLKAALIADRRYGPYMVYIPTAYETILDKQFKAASDRTIREVLMSIKNIVDIKVVDVLADDTIVMVQMTSDVIRLIEGLPITTIEWETEGKMMHHFKVMNILVPQVRSDYNSRCGIAIMS